MKPPPLSWTSPWLLLAAGLATIGVPAVAAPPKLSLAWADNLLTIRGAHLPGGELQVWYLEAYCRPGSTDREWGETVIGHQTELLSDEDGRILRLRCKLTDGVEVAHVITAGDDEVDFQLVATNPTARESRAHWAQPCIRVDRFTGHVTDRRADESYLPSCFIFVDGKLTRLPSQPWAVSARYTPGQVWCPKHVDRDDVNPRPLSDIVPSHGIIGCFSADEKLLMASVWEPYQELFQGVISCVHADFRIGGLKPGETKQIRGKIYLMPADVDALLARHADDFPEQYPDAPAAENASSGD
jgi:hypothetical protein